jgi:Fur family ferric uptake transcriptional regulator
MAQLTTSERASLLDRFRRYLSDHRLPLTGPRNRIAGELCHTDGHLSAADLQKRLAAQGEAVGTATVYRTLELLLESGVARAHDFGDGRKRYEAVPAERGHEHLICLRCKSVVEFSHDRLERMLDLICEEFAFQQRRHHVELLGVCRECRKHDVDL